MPSISPTSGLVWLLIVVLGTGVYVFRLSFIHLHGVVDDFPPRLERALTYMPAAILAALVTPALFPMDASITTTILNVRALAGALAVATAWRTGSMIATIGVGMGVLWSVGVLVS